jgi:hypothetical protein
MRGNRYSADGSLPEHDMIELIDALAIRLYERMGHRVYMLDRHGIAELVGPLIDDLCPDDQRAVPWLLWDLFQEAQAIEFG